MKFARSATAVLILSAALAACGGGSAPGASGPTSPPVQPSAPVQTLAPVQSTAPVQSAGAIDVCALITEKEATAFLGFDPGPGVNTGSADSPACGFSASLVVLIDLTGGRAMYDLKHGQSTVGNVAGLGDAAYATIVANTVADMEILKGSMIVSIIVQGDPTLQNITLSALTALGKTVVGRL